MYISSTLHLSRPLFLLYSRGKIEKSSRTHRVFACNTNVAYEPEEGAGRPNLCSLRTREHCVHCRADGLPLLLSSRLSVRARPYSYNNAAATAAATAAVTAGADNTLLGAALSSILRY